MSKDKEGKQEEASAKEKEEIQEQAETCEAETITIEALEEKLSELEAENNDLNDKYLRKSAEFENFRKRMIREKEDAIRFANSTLLLDLIAIIDDFERAIKASEESQDRESFREGIAIIEKQFVSMLEKKWGLKRFESVSEDFNPDFHEALYKEESADVDKPTVVEDYQRGYILHDRVLRPSKVKVLMPLEEKQNDTEND